MGSFSLKTKEISRRGGLGRIGIWVAEGGDSVSANLAGDTEEILMLVHIP